MIKEETLIKMIQETLPSFFRWEREGKLRYGFPYHKKDSHKYQHYYDSYHDHIHRDEKTPKKFHYRFQLDDSPEGDTWISGTFIYGEYGAIEELTYESSFS